MPAVVIQFNTRRRRVARAVTISNNHIEGDISRMNAKLRALVSERQGARVWVDMIERFIDGALARSSSNGRSR